MPGIIGGIDFRLRVLTLNCLWRGAARERLAAVGPLLHQSGVDFVCLQEVVRRRNVRLLERHLRTYQPAVFRPSGTAVAGGLVTFVRRPVERSSYEVFRGRGPHWTLGWADRLLRKGFLTTWLRVDALPVVLVNTHLLANYDEDWAPDNRFARQQRGDLEQLADAVAGLDREALLIVAGDLNVPASSPLFAEFTARAGLRSAFAAPAPPTYPSGHPPHAIDHILYRQPSGRPVRVDARLRFEEPVRLANGHLAFASDHLAIEAEIAADPLT